MIKSITCSSNSDDESFPYDEVILDEGGGGKYKKVSFSNEMQFIHDVQMEPSSLIDLYYSRDEIQHMRFDALFDEIAGIDEKEKVIENSSSSSRPREKEASNDSGRQHERKRIKWIKWRKNNGGAHHHGEEGSFTKRALKILHHQQKEKESTSNSCDANTYDLRGSEEKKPKKGVTSKSVAAAFRSLPRFVFLDEDNPDNKEN